MSSDKAFNPFEMAQTQFDKVAEILNLDEATKQLLRNPLREFHFSIPVRMDDGTTKVFRGFRVQHNDARGPSKGGIRFHPQETVDTVKVIDVISSTGGSILKILMNAEIDEAIGMFADQSTETSSEKEYKEVIEYHPSDYWRWRMKMAEKIASELDSDRFGVKGIYIFGSTKNAVSGPGSDIDLIVHIEKEKCNMKELSLWFEGWSLALSEMNYLRTGYKSSWLLDVHFVTDEDIKNKSSYASKIGAVTDAARPLKFKPKAN